jgi:hypothetical protein
LVMHPLLLLPPPQLARAPRATMATRMPSMESQLRRRAGMPKKRSRARTTPEPAPSQPLLPPPGRAGRARSALVAAVVEMDSVAVAGVVPLKVTEDGETLQVAGSVEALLVNEQVRLTVPEKPPDPGVTVTLDVLPVVAPGATLMLPLLDIEKVGGTAVTVTFAVAVCVMVPETPVTVMA